MYLSQNLGVRYFDFVLICLPFGMLCEKIGLPTLFGYVMTGVLLGPSGLNVLKSMVRANLTTT